MERKSCSFPVIKNVHVRSAAIHPVGLIFDGGVSVSEQNRGTVRMISEGTFDKQAGETGTARSYYRTRVELDPDSKLRGVGEHFRLIPGMVSQAEIKVGRRRVIEYLILPLIKSLDEAIREP